MRKNRFGDSITLVQGHPFRSQLFNERGDGMPLVRIRDVKRGRSNTYTTEECPVAQIVEDGALLIGMDGDFNLARWSGGRAALNQRVMMLGSSKDGTSVEFAALWLEPQLERIHASTTFTTVKHLSSRVVAALPFDPPPLDKQRRIVDLIAAVDDAVDAAEAEADTAKTARDEMLTAMLAARDGWRETTLSDVVGASRDRYRPRDYDEAAEVILYSIPALDSHGGPEVTTAGGILSDKFAISTDAVLVSMLNPRIPRRIRAYGGENVACSTEFAVLRSDSVALTLEYLSVITRQAAFFEFLDRRAKGSTGSRKRAKIADALAFPIALPPLDEQRRIVATVESVDDALDAARATADALRELRSNLLTVLLSGEHEIPSSYDALLEEVA